VNTAKTGTKITPSKPFTDILPITAEKLNEHNSTTLRGETLGVNKVQYYPRAASAKKKLPLPNLLLQNVKTVISCRNSLPVQSSGMLKFCSSIAIRQSV